MSDCKTIKEFMEEETPKMINFYRDHNGGVLNTSGYEDENMSATNETTPLNIPTMHEAFNDLRDMLNKSQNYLEQIYRVLDGQVGAIPVNECPKEPKELLPHLCSIGNNIECLKIRIEKQHDIIEKIYIVLGMDIEKIY